MREKWRGMRGGADFELGWRGSEKFELGGGGGGWEEVGIELGWGDGGKFELGGEMLENLNWVGEDGGEFELGGYWGLEMVGIKNL